MIDAALAYGIVGAWCLLLVALDGVAYVINRIRR
jgi:hypothetical protein